MSRSDPCKGLRGLKRQVCAYVVRNGPVPGARIKRRFGRRGLDAAIDLLREGRIR